MLKDLIDSRVRAGVHSQVEAVAEAASRTYLPASAINHPVGSIGFVAEEKTTPRDLVGSRARHQGPFKVSQALQAAEYHTYQVSLAFLRTEERLRAPFD